MEELEKPPPCNPDCSKPESSPSSTWFDMELALRTTTSSETEPFRLDQAVCSHGLFMMAPNRWDPLTNTLTRPLRLHHHDSDPSSSSPSFIVTVSQRSESIAVRVHHGTHLLSPHEVRALMVPTSLTASLNSWVFIGKLISVVLFRFRLRCRECCDFPKRKRKL